MRLARALSASQNPARLNLILKANWNNAQFPSGQWFGFYTYHGNDRRFLMDLVLEFRAGKMTGEGSDGVGLFVIAGDYDAGTGECGWKKQYVGRQVVDYKGFRDATGIWGAWTILSVKGGFHIWPIAEGERLKEGAELEDASQPATIKVSEPSLAPAALGRIQSSIIRGYSKGWFG